MSTVVINLLIFVLDVQDGMVKFDSNPENYSSPDMLHLLEAGVLAAITLDKQVTDDQLVDF